MIPRRFLYRMGIYNIPIDNDSILQAVVADDRDVIDYNLKRLKFSLKSSVMALVGIDVKHGRNGCNDDERMLVLSSQTFCLLVSFSNKVPKSVNDFLTDRTICFVAMNYPCRTRYGLLELSNLAARVLKKPGLNTCRCIKTLAGEVGVKWRQLPKLADEKEVGTRCGILFSQEEIEFLIQNAYYTVVMADKLFDSLEE